MVNVGLRFAPTKRQQYTCSKIAVANPFAGWFNAESLVKLELMSSMAETTNECKEQLDFMTQFKAIWPSDDTRTKKGEPPTVNCSKEIAL